jgi:hypothetical protein
MNENRIEPYLRRQAQRDRLNFQRGYEQAQAERRDAIICFLMGGFILGAVATLLVQRCL